MHSSFLLLCLVFLRNVFSFTVTRHFPFRTTFTFLNAKKSSRATSSQQPKRQRSRVTDPDGPTPDASVLDVTEIDEDDPIFQDVRNADDLPRPIPHQPWRRGDTSGCEAPIAAPWRVQAESIIQMAASMAGGSVLDVTWYLTQVVVTIDEEMMPSDMLKSSGPVIDVIQKASPLYFDPNDPEPEDIENEDVVFQYTTPDEAAEAAQRRRMMYATKDSDDPEDETHIPDQEGIDPEVPLYINEETRDDIALKVTEEALSQYEQEEKPLDMETIRIDTAALSIIAKSIIDALEEYEDELKILSRHELILTSPGANDVLETQRQFNAYRGFDVIVETQDPFESNRVLKGKLMDRNSMDLIINKKGRMVTIPLNFVKCVRLPPAKREKGVPRDAPF